MKKRTVMQATDPVVSRKVAIPDQRDQGGSIIFTSGVKTLTTITAVAAVVSVFVPAALGVAMFTGLLTVLALVMTFVSSVKFNNQYDAADDDDSSWLLGFTNPASPNYYPNSNKFC